MNCGDRLGESTLALSNYGPKRVITLDASFLPERKEILERNGAKEEFVKAFLGDGRKHLLDGSVYTPYFHLRVGRPVETSRLDDLVESDEVKLLKMDLEGFERFTLLGAERLLRKHRPVLIIAAYHSALDLFEIPRLVSSLTKDYVCRGINLAPFWLPSEFSYVCYPEELDPKPEAFSKVEFEWELEGNLLRMLVRTEEEREWVFPDFWF